MSGIPQIKHKQLTTSARSKLATYAVAEGVNKAAREFGVHYDTAKRWYLKYVNCRDLLNDNAEPLNDDDFRRLDKYKNYVNNISLQALKIKFDLPYTIFTMAKYYRTQNIPRNINHLKILKCASCKSHFRVIIVFWGKPTSISCPICMHKYLTSLELLHLPFYNPKNADYYIDQNKLTKINNSKFDEDVRPLLTVPKELKCLFVYAVKPRKHNKIHIVKYFEKTDGNTIPITYCQIKYPKLNARRVLNPRTDAIDIDNICYTCQNNYLHVYKKGRDRFPSIINAALDPEQFAIELFLLAQQYNNKTAQALLGVNKRKFYKIKRKYMNQFSAIEKTFKGNF